MSRFRFIEDGLCCDVFYDKRKNNDECALFLYGFPATVGSNKLTDVLVEMGYTVLQPHYLGTYDSKGDFTPQSAFDTVKKIETVVNKSLVKNLKNNTMYKLPNRISVCIGYSFGAYVMRHTITYLKNVKNLILVSPVMSNNISNSLCWVNEDGLTHLNYVLRTRPFTYRITNKGDWMDKYVNDVVFENIPSDKVETVLWLYGRNDPAMDEVKLKESYIMATRNCLATNAQVMIYPVDEGDHSINSLITEQSQNIIYSILQTK